MYSLMSLSLLAAAAAWKDPILSDCRNVHFNSAKRWNNPATTQATADWRCLLCSTYRMQHKYCPPLLKVIFRLSHKKKQPPPQCTVLPEIWVIEKVAETAANWWLLPSNQFFLADTHRFLKSYLVLMWMNLHVTLETKNHARSLITLRTLPKSGWQPLTRAQTSRFSPVYTYSAKPY